MTEEWRDVPGWEGMYQVSDLGNVKSLARRVGNKIVYERILKPNIVRGGYAQVTLMFHCKQSWFKVHRLVMLAFVGERPTKHAVNHIDGNKLNNTLSNLEYVTYQQNMDHAVKTGLFDFKGDKSIHAKLTNEQVYEIRRLLHDTSLTYQAIADRFSATKAIVYQINIGITWMIPCEYPFPIRKTKRHPANIE